MPAGSVQVIQKNPSALHFLFQGLAQGQEQSRVAEVMRGIDGQSQQGAIGGLGGNAFPSQTPPFEPQREELGGTNEQGFPQQQQAPLTGEQRLAIAQRKAKLIMMSPQLTPEQKEQALKGLEVGLAFEKERAAQLSGARQEERSERQEDRADRLRDQVDRELDLKEVQGQLDILKHRNDFESKQRKLELEGFKEKAINEVMSRVPEGASGREIFQALTDAGVHSKEATEIAGAFKKQEAKDNRLNDRLKRINNAADKTMKGINSRYKVSIDGTLQFMNKKERAQYSEDATKAQIRRFTQLERELKKAGEDTQFLQEQIDDVNEDRIRNGFQPINPLQGSKSKQNLRGSLREAEALEVLQYIEEAGGDEDLARKRAKEDGIDLDRMKKRD